MSTPVQQVLAKAKQHLLDGHLGAAIRVMANVYGQRPSLFGYETFKNIQQDHTLMLDYMLRGFADDQRERVYQGMLKRMYTLVADLEISWRCKNLRVYSDAFHRADHLNLSPVFVQEVLERYVGDATMLSLESEDTVAAKHQSLAERHQAFMDRLFCAIFVSCQWTKDQSADFHDILLLPTVDTNDVLLMVSAISLSAAAQFDMAKTTLLADVYLQTQEEAVRERALVGFVLSLQPGTLFGNELKDLLRRMLTDDRFAGDLTELQKQTFYCLNADQDHELIQKDIMPNILKNSKMHVTRFGIEEREADALEDILHPEAEDKAMEEMEQSINRMRDMLKAGSDIYFGGFSQMKRFPFFSQMSNWLTPFTIDHPALGTVRAKLQSTGFLPLLFQQTSFCDSDKYSLALGLAQVIDRVPASMREMLGNEEAFGQMEHLDPSRSGVRLRRLYLQDLYRFLRIFPGCRDLLNHLSEGNNEALVRRAMFLLSPLFDAADFQEARVGVTQFLHRKRMKHYCALFAGQLKPTSPDVATICGMAMLDTQDYPRAYDLFTKALRLDSSHTQALRGKATACMRLQRYEEAEQAYAQLCERQPDDVALNLNRSIAQLETGHDSEAVETLFRLNYLHPDNRRIMRVLAWGLLAQKKVEQAERYYARLLADGPEAGDWLNAGYAAWMLGRVSDACQRFTTYIKESHADDAETLLRDAFAADRRMLASHGKTEFDRVIMTEAVLKTL